MKPTIRYVVNYLLAPIVFLTVALAGGIRFQVGTNTFQFVYPPLVSCIVGALAIVLLMRCGIGRTAESLSQGAGPDGEQSGVLENASRALLIIAVYFATVQVFSLVTPDSGLFFFFFNVFYLLILLNDLFVVFNPRRLAGALAVILGASFMLKYLVLAAIFSPASSWGNYILQELLKTGSLGALDQEPFAPATGYLAFFTVAFYVLGLFLIAPRSARSASGDALLYAIRANRYGVTTSEPVLLEVTVASRERASHILEPAEPARAALARTTKDPQDLSLSTD